MAKKTEKKKSLRELMADRRRKIDEASGFGEKKKPAEKKKPRGPKGAKYE